MHKEHKEIIVKNSKGERLVTFFQVLQVVGPRDGNHLNTKDSKCSQLKGQRAGMSTAWGAPEMFFFVNLSIEDLVCFEP